jgi:hypothetical protein
MHTNTPRSNPKLLWANREPIAIVLAVADRAQTTEDTDTLTAAHIITDWTRTFCPTTTIHYSDLIQELSGGRSKTTYTNANWRNMVEEAWDWIESSYSGLPMQAHSDKIRRLKGSTTSTKSLIMKAATILFRQLESPLGGGC